MNESLDKHLKEKLFYIKSLVSGRNEGTEKAMAPHSSTLAWKIPWKEENDI